MLSPTDDESGRWRDRTAMHEHARHRFHANHHIRERYQRGGGAPGTASHVERAPYLPVADGDVRHDAFNNSRVDGRPGKCVSRCEARAMVDTSGWQHECNVQRRSPGCAQSGLAAQEGLARLLPRRQSAHA